MFGIIEDKEIFLIDDSYSEDKVKAVSMGEIETTTDNQKVLFTFGLETCIGIYAYSKNFGLLGHIDSGDMLKTHFEHTYNQIDGKWVNIPGKFKQTGEIMYIIRQNIDKISSPLKIGLVVGTSATSFCIEEIKKIDFAIESIIEMVKDIGIAIEKQEPIISPSVIVDTENLLLKTEEPRPLFERKPF